MGGTFLDAFAYSKKKKAPVTFITSVRASFFPYASAWFPLDEFPCILVMGIFMKIY
jgi:hypothetical protein